MYVGVTSVTFKDVPFIACIDAWIKIFVYFLAISFDTFRYVHLSRKDYLDFVSEKICFSSFIKLHVQASAESVSDFYS